MNEAVVDSCCFINLYATGRIRDVLRIPGSSWHLPSRVIAESLYIRTKDEHGEIVLADIDTQALLDEGVLHGVIRPAMRK